MTDRLAIDVSPSERVAIVTFALARGESLAPLEVAAMAECHLSTAYRLLERISRVLPLYEDAGRWALLREIELTID